MDGKLWAPIAALLVAILAMYGYREFDKYDTANTGLFDAKATLENVKSSLEVRKKALDQLNAMVNTYRVEQARLDKSVQVKAEAEAKQRRVEEGMKYLAKSIPESVEKVRANGISLSFPELVLLNGKKLASAKIKKVDNSGISFSHSEGFVTVPVDNLPPSLAEQFDLGSTNLAAEFALLERSMNTNPVVVAPAKVAPAAPAPPTAAVTDEQLKEARLNLAAVESKIAELLRNREAWLAKATDLSNQISLAAYRGVPTYNLKVEEQKARTQVALCLHQLNQLDGEYRKLKVVEEFATKGSNR